MTLVDANLLLYACDARSPHHAPARRGLTAELSSGRPIRLAPIAGAGRRTALRGSEVRRMRMPRRMACVTMLLAAGLAPPALAQPDPWAGTWRGELTSAPDASTPVSLTLVAEADGAYTGLVDGLAPGAGIRLDRVAVDGGQVTVEAAADTAFGPLSIVYTLVRDGRELSGAGRVTAGGHGFDVALALSRARRADVPQPQIEPRIGYFSGVWRFEYTGGEFPPLSVGTRNGTVAFEPLPGAPFVRGRAVSDLFGEPYEETWTIGFDEATRAVVWQERRPGGGTLTALGNWTSPIAITFLTAPVEADGRVHVLRRVVRTTSESAFAVVDEFSVDGGPFRRLGNGSYLRNGGAGSAAGRRP